MTIVDLDEAATHLAALIERAEAGEEILIARRGRPVIQLLPRRIDPPELKPREGGQLRGKIWIAPDFDELPEEIARAFGMGDA